MIASRGPNQRSPSRSATSCNVRRRASRSHSVHSLTTSLYIDRMRRRPRVRVTIPRPLYPGDEFEVQVLLDVAGELPIDDATVRLTGIEKVTVGGGKSAHTERVS